MRKFFLGEVTNALGDPKPDCGYVTYGECEHIEDGEIEIIGKDAPEVAKQIYSAVTESQRLREAISAARAQLHAVHAVDQVAFLKGAIGAALQVLEL